jgi:26S proteasome regulatory subunit T6
MQVMGKNKVLVKVHPEGKYVVDLDKDIDIAQARQSLHQLSIQASSCYMLLPSSYSYLIQISQQDSERRGCCRLLQELVWP